MQELDNQTRAAVQSGALAVLTTCRDCGTGLTLDVAQEYQLCSRCEMIAGVDDATSQYRSEVGR